MSTAGSWGQDCGLMDRPTTSYVMVGDAQVAYTVMGGGDEPDLIWCGSLGGNVELFWRDRIGGEFLDRLSTDRRVILFDRRGCGASDAVPRAAIPTWEELAEDLGAVLDASGSTRAAVMGAIESGPIAVLFAAMHPERVSQLVLINTSARFMEADDYAFGMPESVVVSFVELLASSWGTEEFVRIASPSLANDPELVDAWAHMFRSSATPRSAAAQFEYFMRSVDVRTFLPMVQAPTVVLHVADNLLMPLAHGRYLADHIPGATFVEIPGSDLSPTAVAERSADILEFLTGERPSHDVDRVLTTILFSDIVGSTERGSALGDDRWKALLDSHDRTVREQIRRFKGHEVNTTGDGFVVSFDGVARAVRCAREIRKSVARLGLEIRIGLHTGECQVRGDDFAGLAVHVAARIGALAAPNEILVSATLADLVAGSGLEFTERGEYELKGASGTWRLHAVMG